MEIYIENITATKDALTQEYSDLSKEVQFNTDLLNWSMKAENWKMCSYYENKINHMTDKMTDLRMTIQDLTNAVRHLTHDNI